MEGITEVCITTNGTLLTPMAKQLRKAGVSRVNTSLDTLNKDKRIQRLNREMGHLTDYPAKRALLETKRNALRIERQNAQKYFHILKEDISNFRRPLTITVTWDIIHSTIILCLPDKENINGTED